MTEESGKSQEPRTLCQYFSQWEEFDDTVFYDEFDAAFMGFGWQFSTGPVTVYNQDLVMEILMEDGTSAEDALEHFSFNVIGSYVGERTPIFLTNVNDGAVKDFMKRQAGAEISGWSPKFESGAWESKGLREIR